MFVVGFLRLLLFLYCLDVYSNASLRSCKNHVRISPTNPLFNELRNTALFAATVHFSADSRGFLNSIKKTLHANVYIKAFNQMALEQF